MAKARVIAFYLPQYYPTETNDKWFGPGFTEWTNVGKARRLFRGHYQPRVPRDLGYYDLRNPEVRAKQAELAKEAGIEGFCYYHYWFGNGRQELDLPFREVVESGTPNFPFCLCWANQSWYSKFWNKDAQCAPRLIIEQRYDDDEGIRSHFLSLLPAFMDSRYIKVDGRLLFMIYRPDEYSEIVHFIQLWRSLAKSHLDSDFYFVAQATSEKDVQRYIDMGFDGVNLVRKDDFFNNWRYANPVVKYFNKIKRAIGLAPYHYPYRKVMKYFVKLDGVERSENVFPTLIPNWDHSPRGGKQTVVFHDSTPELFGRHVADVLDVVNHKEFEYSIVFLKSWNEWGEGNYMEPDLKYGKGYIEVLGDLICNKKE